MGFRIQRRTCVLEFDPEKFPEYEGAEVHCRLDIDTEAFLELERLQSAITDDAASGEKVRGMLGFFADNIVTAWNLEDENGEALPVTLDALMAMPPKLTLNLIPLWKAAAIGIDAPLEEASPNGNTSGEPSTPREES